VKGSYGGYDVEIVPCFKGGEMRSSVDRTPLHLAYVNKKLAKSPKLSDEIRLLKQFMKGANVYGAEAKFEGFSGYLTEVLAIHYKSFTSVLQAASKWSGVAALDPEGQWEDPSASNTSSQTRRS